VPPPPLWPNQPVPKPPACAEGALDQLGPRLLDSIFIDGKSCALLAYPHSVLRGATIDQTGFAHRFVDALFRRAEKERSNLGDDAWDMEVGLSVMELTGNSMYDLLLGFREDSPRRPEVPLRTGGFYRTLAVDRAFCPRADAAEVVPVQHADTFAVNLRVALDRRTAYSKTESKNFGTSQPIVRLELRFARCGDTLSTLQVLLGDLGAIQASPESRTSVFRTQCVFEEFLVGTCFEGNHDKLTTLLFPFFQDGLVVVQGIASTGREPREKRSPSPSPRSPQAPRRKSEVAPARGRHIHDREAGRAA